MKIEVGKKYQDKHVADWTIEVIGKQGDSFLVRYPDGGSQDLLPKTIEELYKPFEETECVA